MIKFFRHIRQSMINNNKFSKYLLYAIGEIILVVIGILIALQINNWSEKYKESAKEQKLMRQLLKDLRQTDEDLMEITSFFQTKAKQAQAVVHSFWMEDPKNDSLTSYFLGVRQNRKYNPILGSAKSLVNSGNIEIIESEQAKDAIIKYVDVTNARLKDIERLEETYFRHASQLVKEEFDVFSLMVGKAEGETLKRASEEDFWPIPKSFEQIPFPVNYEDIFRNEKIYNAYIYYLSAHRNTYFRYRDIQQDTQHLIALILSERYD